MSWKIIGSISARQPVAARLYRVKTELQSNRDEGFSVRASGGLSLAATEKSSWQATRRTTSEPWGAGPLTALLKNSRGRLFYIFSSSGVAKIVHDR